MQPKENQISDQVQLSSEQQQEFVYMSNLTTELIIDVFKISNSSFPFLAFDFDLVAVLPSSSQTATKRLKIELSYAKQEVLQALQAEVSRFIPPKF